MLNKLLFTLLLKKLIRIINEIEKGEIIVYLLTGDLPLHLEKKERFKKNKNVTFLYIKTISYIIKKMKSLRKL